MKTSRSADHENYFGDTISDSFYFDETIEDQEDLYAEYEVVESIIKPITYAQFQHSISINDMIL